MPGDFTLYSVEGELLKFPDPSGGVADAAGVISMASSDGIARSFRSSAGQTHMTTSISRAKTRPRWMRRSRTSWTGSSNARSVWKWPLVQRGGV